MKKHRILLAVIAPRRRRVPRRNGQRPRKSRGSASCRFTNQTSAGWWSASVGRELSDMLASELVSTRSFQVLDRKDIDAVLGEQDLSDTDRVSEATKVKMGKLKGAKYLVAATVSSYEEDVKGTGGGVRFKGLSVGGKKDKAYIAVDLKVVDTETGEIVDARTIEAEAKGQALAAGLSLQEFQRRRRRLQEDAGREGHPGLRHLYLRVPRMLPDPGHRTPTA